MSLHLHLRPGRAAGVPISHVPDRGVDSAVAPSPSLAVATLVIAGVVIAVLTAVAAAAWIRALRAALHRESRNARHDPLTDLPNRRVVEDLLQSQPGPAVIGLLDLDHFKAVNDHIGHSAGDQLLQVTASRLATAMADRGLAARLAGDEFALLWDHVPAHLPAEATALLRALGHPVSIVGRRHHPTASLGLAIRTPTLTGADLLGAADAAMYIAKRNGTGIHISTADPSPASASDTDSPSAETDSRELDNNGRRGRRALRRRPGRRRHDP
jgi:diguanylate cyclase (GGDEF)-like protein